MAEANRNIVCPDCGATLAAGQARCWLCEQKLAAAATENPYASPRPTSEDLLWQISLTSMFLIATLVAVCLGVFLLAPGLGILLGIFVTPALVRTAIDAAQYKQAGSPLGALGKIESFVVSLFVVGAVAIAACMAFVTVCFAGAVATEASSLGPNGIVFALLIGALAALVAIVNVFWLTRPRR